MVKCTTEVKITKVFEEEEHLPEVRVTARNATIAKSQDITQGIVGLQVGQKPVKVLDSVMLIERIPLMNKIHLIMLSLPTTLLLLQKTMLVR